MSGDLQTSRYDQLIRRVGGIIGPGSKVTEALAELFPIVELENTTPELIALSGWRPAWQSTERISGAGNRCTHQLFNPAGSGVICAITQLGIRVTPADFMQAEIVSVAIGTPIPGLFRDSRFGVPRGTTCTVASLDGGGAGGGIRYRLASNELLNLRDDNGIVVLTPGAGLSVGSVANAATVTIDWWWRERLAEESELSFPT